MTMTDTHTDTTWLDCIKWDANGLIPAIAQDHETGRVLMVAWMNREALQLTVQENRAIYWSRSRGKLWRKGEESGHVQVLHELRLDCDSDVIIMQVEQRGGIACHTGSDNDGIEFFLDHRCSPSSQYVRWCWRTGACGMLR